jgi:hypothetical protein
MVLPPWAAAQPALRPGRPEQIPVPVGQIGLGILALSLPLGGVYLARRNLRLGRGDRQGAFRVALFVFATYSVARILRMDHVSNFAQELALLIQALAYPAFFAGLVWVLYLAVEPYARRRWPHMLISWKRLLAGKLRDPMVGRDLLIGGAVGVALFVLFYASLVAPPLLGRPAPTPQRFVHGPTLAHLSQVGFRIFVNQYSGVLYAMVFLFMLVLLRVILRRQWLAVLAWCALVGNPLIDADPLTEWLFGIARALLLLLVLMRGGLLALAAALVYLFTLIESPLTLHLDAWYAGRQVPVLLVLGGVAAYAFHTALGGKALFGNASLDE